VVYIYAVVVCLCVTTVSYSWQVIAGKTQLTEVDRSCYISNTVTADIDINSRLSKAGDACIWQTATSSLEWTQHTNDNVQTNDVGYVNLRNALSQYPYLVQTQTDLNTPCSGRRLWQTAYIQGGPKNWHNFCTP